MEDPRIAYLLDKIETAEATPEELHELAEAVKADIGGELAGLIDARLRTALPAGKQAGPDSAYDEQTVESLIQRILQADRSSGKVIGFPAIRRQRQWQVAAAILVLMISCGWFFSRIRHTGQVKIVGTLHQQDDVAPGGNRAILTLGNGDTITLDSAANGTITRQGNTRIVKLANGQLSYTAGKETNEVLFNTMSTPRGGQYQLRLPDGTGVWLNSASSITYPTAFTGKERQVTVRGEVYFEVAENASKPFRVSAPLPATSERAGGSETADRKEPGNRNMEVEVLGTHFNINAYDDDPAVRTTLLEGAVGVKAGGDHKIIRPGQQAVVVTGRKEIGLATAVDLEEVMAWKNGLFQFNNADIRSVMRQLARWYDVEVRYEGEPTRLLFEGKIPRDANASQVLRVLEKNHVHFRLEGKTITVLP